jgi:hypothetical protein
MPAHPPVTRPDGAATTLCKAALQATARALHTAQIAADLIARHGGDPSTGGAMTAMRDKLLDAYRCLPEPMRKAIFDCKCEVSSDELLELLSLVVRGENPRAHATTTQNHTSKEP